MLFFFSIPNVQHLSSLMDIPDQLHQAAKMLIKVWASVKLFAIITASSANCSHNNNNSNSNSNSNNNIIIMVVIITIIIIKLLLLEVVVVLVVYEPLISSGKI